MGKVLAVKQRSLRNGVLSLAAVSLLAACGSDRQSDPILDAVVGLASGLVGSGGEAAPGPVMDRAAISASEVPLILAIVQDRGTQAVLYPVGSNGPVTTWSTADAATLAVREGIVVGTRGLGNDLMSAAAPGRAQVLTGEGTHQRSYFILDGEDRTQREDFTCILSRHPATRIEIIERSYEVREVKETCTGTENAFANRYWITASGQIAQSIQWLGKDVGFLQLADLSI